VIADHAVDVGPDPSLVAAVELLEGVVVAGSDGGDQQVVVAIGACPLCCGGRSG